MDTNSFKTNSLNKTTVDTNWVLIDADSQVLGRMATRISMIIRGKHKPSFTPHVRCGDHVIVINAEKLRLTGKKWLNKNYVRHTGYPGGQKIETAKEVANRRSSTVLIERAVKGMLPKNRLGRKLFGYLHVYANHEHPYDAQQPQKIEI